MKTPLETSHSETRITQQPHGAYIPEDEPAGDYRVGWRTLMAIVALSMANACAAIANTVCLLLFMPRINVTYQPAISDTC